MNELSRNDWKSMTDGNLMSHVGNFIKHHRLNQNKSQSETAKSAGVSRSTLSLLERGEKVNLSSLIQVLRVLDLLHIMDVFTINQEVSPIAYAKLHKNKRQRASKVEEGKSTFNEDIGW